MEDDAWKIADFGLTVEGTSQKLIDTVEGKGTSGYRAPELLTENPIYNNKVDIWAMGCILYELISGQKAFSSDHAVMEWSFSKTEKKLPLENIDEVSGKTISHLIGETLRKDPKLRPSAKYFYQTLGSFFGLPIAAHSEEKSNIDREVELRSRRGSEGLSNENDFI